MTIDERLQRIEAKLDLLLGAQAAEGARLDAQYLATLPVVEVKRRQREKLLACRLERLGWK